MASTSTLTSAADERDQPSFVASGLLIVLGISVAKLLFHSYFNNRYGYFRDEFDYISCGDHLAWGYVDQPPLIPFLIHVCGRYSEIRFAVFGSYPPWRLLCW